MIIHEVFMKKSKLNHYVIRKVVSSLGLHETINVDKRLQYHWHALRFRDFMKSSGLSRTSGCIKPTGFLNILEILPVFLLS